MQNFFPPALQCLSKPFMYQTFPTLVTKGVEVGTASFEAPKFLVFGHRGNMLQSTDRRMKVVKENTILSFNTAGNYPVDFVLFDIQGTVFEARVTELPLSEFLSYGPQKEARVVGKRLLRKTEDGKFF